MRNENSYGTGMFSMLTAAALALAVSFLSVVLFAVILRSASLSERLVYPVTQTVKGVSLAVGVLVFVRGEKGWLKGGGVGLLFSALSYLAFSSLGGDFSLSWLIFAELAISLAVGALAGILAVNLKG